MPGTVRSARANLTSVSLHVKRTPSRRCPRALHPHEGQVPSRGSYRSWKALASARAPHLTLLLTLHLGAACAPAVVAEETTPHAAAGQAPRAVPGDQVRFRKIVLDTTFRAEGVATGDVNRDGRTDVITGDVWYEAPPRRVASGEEPDAARDWKMHELRRVGSYNPAKGYSKCFANFAQDVNGDGWVDSIVVGFPGAPALWYENPQGKAGHWKERRVWRRACNETPLLADLRGSGKPVLVFAYKPEGVMAWFGVPDDIERTWDAHAVSGRNAPGTAKYAHGLGVGDVNGDGRNDVLVKEGWWEAPENRRQAEWTFHKAALGPDCANLIVYDVDGDGDNDVVTSSAHRYGIWWFEQERAGADVRFEQHEISKLFSQTHALILADVNRDGLEDLVTGKRHFAHNGKDPGGRDPAVLYWYELRRAEGGGPEFVPHRIDDDSGIGTQFEVCDLDGDGTLDVVTSNKKGVHVFLQEPPR